MALEFVDTKAADGTSNVLLYGPPGVGKSAGAGTAPGPILYLNAEGSGRSRFARGLHGDKLREVEVTGKQVLRDAMLEVKQNPGRWATVVLDTVGETYRVLTDEAAGGMGMPQVQHYGDAGKTLERFVRFMRDMPVTLVLVSHEEVVDGPDGALLMPGGFGRSLPAKVCGWVDYVGYVAVIPPADGEGGGPRRVVQFRAGNGRYAKDSGAVLGPVADMDIAAWLRAIAADSTKDGE